jgi:Xaa-Pro aminopeptidase
LRKDLDRLMQERDLAGLVVLAFDCYAPAMHYCAGRVIGHGVYLRGADGRTHLVHDPMERDQAAQVGCETSEFAQRGFAKMLEQEPARPEAMGRLIGELCGQMEFKGRVAFYGPADLGQGYRVLERAMAANPGMSVDRSVPDIVTVARATKDEDEVRAIRRAGDVCAAALARLRAFLAGLSPDGEQFRAGGKGPVRLGDLRALIGEELLRQGNLEIGEAILSQGRDAGVPHNRGDDAEPLRRGAPLIVDVFPKPAGGGYFFDITRTYCLGPVSDELRRLYQDVKDALMLSLDALRAGEPCRSYQMKVCELFEARGHGTARQTPGLHEGYVHNLGHGVGLDVHEAPLLGGPATNTQMLEPGMVVTVEPGLYYPSRGLGVRLEDTVRVRADGGIENLTDVPYDLEIPIRA